MRFVDDGFDNRRLMWRGRRVGLPFRGLASKGRDPCLLRSLIHPQDFVIQEAYAIHENLSVITALVSFLFYKVVYDSA